MWRAVILAALLSGCVSTTPTKVVDTPTYHPPLPDPYAVCQVEWRVVEVDGEMLVGVSYQDNLNLAVCIKDMERFISQLMGVTCHYREELKEVVCRKEQHDTKN